MQTLLERTLLYAVALATVGMLLFSRSPDQEAPVAAPAVDAREAISLRDDQGNERIRLAVEDGEPAIVVFAADGKEAFRVQSLADGTTHCEIAGPGGLGARIIGGKDAVSFDLTEGRRTAASIQANADGATAITLASPGDGPELRLDCTREQASAAIGPSVGENQTIALTGSAERATLEIAGSRSRIHLEATDDGESQLGVFSGSESESSAFMRLTSDGVSEISARGPDGLGGPTLFALPTGDIGLAVKQADGRAGATVQSLSGGQAEVSVAGADGVSGAGMIRQQDGSATMYVRGGDRRGPRLILAADQRPRLQLDSHEEGGQIAVGLDDAGAPTVRLVDREGKTLFSVPMETP